ncbi:hypothetical protein [Enterococcus sp. AZ109]|uniref:hypothetical protein n=1 Tax=Enterococcus sp. AZ109 TaxID=2774634 RepID=UPI003F233E9E
MEKRKNYLRWGIMLVVSLFLFGACDSSEKYNDADEYVKSMLDAQIKGDFEKYVEMTDATQKEAEVMYEEAIEAQMQSLAGRIVSDELTEKYRELFKNILQQTKYEVGEAEEVDADSVIVPIEVETLQMYVGVDDALAVYHEQLMSEIDTQLNQTGTGLSEAEYSEKFHQRMYELLKERVENPTYGEKITFEVKVSKNDEELYEADHLELKKVGDNLIDKFTPAA